MLLFGPGGEQCDLGLAVEVRREHFDPELAAWVRVRREHSDPEVAFRAGRKHCDLEFAAELRRRKQARRGRTA